jgi:double-stranded uracil-DNA glycosylase
VNSGLRDRVGRGVRVLFVGINPGVRSAAIGHHFAGYSNRFWKLLYDAALIPEPIGTEDDYRLPEWRFGITNLIPRTTPGIDTLRFEEYEAGLRVLRRKVRRWKPEIVAFVGVTLFRFVAARPASARVGVGLQVERFEGARVFVLPNPSGRNANFSYTEMLTAYQSLATFLHDETHQHAPHRDQPPRMQRVDSDRGPRRERRLTHQQRHRPDERQPGDKNARRSKRHRG